MEQSEHKFCWPNLSPHLCIGVGIQEIASADFIRLIITGFKIA
jgi:hypothetical protein